MPMSFLDHCLTQAMNDQSPNGNKDGLEKWATAAYDKAQALDDVRRAMNEKKAEEAQEHVNQDLEHRSAIS